MWYGPTVKIGGLLIQDDHKFIDQITWDAMYRRGIREARFPVPAVRYEAVFPWEDEGFPMLIYINDNGRTDDPILVACWDWFSDVPLELRGKYQACYIDCRVAWYKLNGAWDASRID